MIDELGPESRALLEAARAGMSPDAAAVRRMRAKLGVATGGAVGAVGAKLAIAKLVLGVVGVSAVVGGGWYVARDPDPARSAMVAPLSSAAAVAPPAASPVAPVVRAALPGAAAAPSDEELITIEPHEPPESRERIAVRRPVEPAPARSSSRRGAVRVSPSPAPRAAPEAPASLDLAQEVALVDQAMAALRRGDTQGALVAVHRHAMETAGRGQLAEDAAAIEIEALCRGRDASAGAKLAAFDARFPRSAQRTRLAAQCR